MAANAVIGALRVILGADSAALEKGLKDAQGSLDKFAANVNKSGVAMAAALTTALLGIGLAVKGAINEADKLGKMAQSVGVPVEELSRLKHAADLSGVSLESLGKGFGRLSKNMMEAATDAKGTAGQAFAAIGVSVKNADGTLKNSSQIMTELAGKFAVMKDGAGKTALAMALFGRAGAELIPMLNLGKQGLAEMLAEADELGIVIDSKTARAAEAFNDNLTRMSKITSGIVMKVTAEMLPAFLQFSQVLLDTAKNQGMVKTFAEGLVSVFRWLVKEVVLVVVGFRQFYTETTAIFEGISIAAKNFSKVFTKDFWLGGKEQVDDFVKEMNRAGKVVSDGFQKSEEIGRNANKFIEQFYKDAEATAAAQGPRVAQTIAAPFVAGTKAAKDALEKFLASTVKRQAGLEAEAQTIGLSVGAHERLKTILQAEAIAKEENIKLTDAQKARVLELANASGVLADAIERQKERWNDFKSAVLQVRSSLENAFVDAIMQAKSFKEIIKSLISDLARMAAQAAFRQLFGGQLAWSNAAGSAFNSGGIGGLFSGVGKLFGFASGGSFQVGGSGGTDSQLVAFKASPNERVNITKPGQDMGAGITNHYSITADFRGAEASAVASLSLKMDRLVREIPNMTLAASRNAVALNSRALG